MVNHGQSSSTMVQRCVVTKIASIWKSTMVDHGRMSHCDKYFLDIKINHGQAWSNTALWQGLSQNKSQPRSTMFILGFLIFILGFIYLGFIILAPWVYNINPLGLYYSPGFIILWVLVLIPWFYYSLWHISTTFINMVELIILIPWVYHINPSGLQSLGFVILILGFIIPWVYNPLGFLIP